ncbi:hypothetical protein [Lentzea jiangxiensis]|uniref:Uncharacterized protein n=1 Tax=Lentzea jiangxiensis TaxID=641025 RepID=A0A1H0VRQ5_9PSEU|nr:hypothetical protein [Lentzea jiangxiensis]SDP81033.1 hypothetical protein SAMN05421507_11591 [Lentzea jiangxiensis]
MTHHGLMTSGQLHRHDTSLPPQPQTHERGADSIERDGTELLTDLTSMASSAQLAIGSSTWFKIVLSGNPQR